MNHPLTLSRRKTGLLIIDVQEKFKPVILGFEEIVQNIVKLVLGCQLFDLPIIVTEQYPEGLGKTIDIIRNQFKPFEPIEKLHFSCVQDKEFSKRLSKLGLENLIVCGIESHVCVNQTVLGLLQKKVNVHVVVDAVSSRRGLDHRMAMEKMMQAGAVPATTEMILFELLETAGAPEFKKIQRMVKSRLKWRGGALTDTTGMKATSMFTPDENQGADNSQAEQSTKPQEQSEAPPPATEESPFEDESPAETQAAAEVAEANEPEDEVFATIEVSDGEAVAETIEGAAPADAVPQEQNTDEKAASAESVAAEAPAQSEPADGKEPDATKAKPEEIEVLDIEALVDLRDTSGEGEEDEKK
ncbi:MAG: isochorismatase family protein [Chitinivibrionales bacterium]|nr:isochorismatase family protein [Chitinivibrionales bacterium]